MSIGNFMLVRNEAPWIGAHLENVMPYLAEAVYYDGNSDDGTPEIIASYPKAKLVRNKDPKDLKDDYVRLFNDCLHELTTDYAIFLHPDMWVENPELLRDFKSDAIALSCEVISYAGEPGKQLYRIEGRSKVWKNIYQLKPDLGAHYFGHYGAQNEDVYFSEITGDEHIHHNADLRAYPYEVKDSGLIIHHFSDVRTYYRRLDRMVKSLMSYGYDLDTAVTIAKAHPRVTLESGGGYIHPTMVIDQIDFVPTSYPEGFLECQRKSEGVLDA